MAGTHQIWAVDPRTDRLELVAGTGVESIDDDLLLQATFAQPSGLTALDRTVYVADAESSAVRALDFDTGRLRRIVGRGLFYFGDLDAIGDSARLQHPQGIVATEEGGNPILYLADTFNNKIKRLDPIRRESSRSPELVNRVTRTAMRSMRNSANRQAWQCMPERSSSLIPTTTASGSSTSTGRS